MEDIFTPYDDPTGPSGKKKFYKFIKHNKSDFNGVAVLKVGANWSVTQKERQMH